MKLKETNPGDIVRFTDVSEDAFAKKPYFRDGSHLKAGDVGFVLSSFSLTPRVLLLTQEDTVLPRMVTGALLYGGNEVKKLRGFARLYWMWKARRAARGYSKDILT